MPQRNVLVSLITNENGYQRAQAEAAISAGLANGLNVEIQYAESEAVLQVQQILQALQLKPRRYDAVIAAPVGTGMEKAARLAAASGIVWCILNYETDYISALRRSAKAAQFEVTNNHLEVGRIQGRQIAALLPHGGVALYIEGPSTGGAAGMRAESMLATKPDNVELKILKGDWTQASTRRSIASWLRLSTSHKLRIAAVICQNDDMAQGVHDAFETCLSGDERAQWLSLPVTGCDGLPNGGVEMVKRGVLAATIIVPANAGTAMELVVRALNGQQVPERTICEVSSYPSEDKLRRVAAAKFAS